MRKVEHEITLVFFTTHEDGARSICDIVETSRHNAYKFMSRNMRAVYEGQPISTHVLALAPNVRLTEWNANNARSLTASTGTRSLLRHYAAASKGAR